jgi:hypothetical protein
MPGPDNRPSQQLDETITMTMTGAFASSGLLCRPVQLKMLLSAP